MRLFRRRPRFKSVLLGLFLAAAAAGGVVLATRPVAVVVARVAPRDLAPAIQGVGTVEAKVMVQLGARIAGRIVAVEVDQGDTVKAGQVLVRLDDAQLRAELLRTDAAVRVAEAQLGDTRAGSRPQEIAEALANVRRAESQLEDLAAGARAPEIEELRERLKAARATRVLNALLLRRSKELHAKEAVSIQEVDRARQAQDVAVAQERAAEQALQLATEGARKHQIAAARAQVSASRRRLDLLRAGSRPRQIEAARAHVREARAALALAKERLGDATVTSPFDGYVVSRLLEPGATVNPGTPIVKLADLRTAWATVHVDEREIAAIAVGNEAALALRSLRGRTLRGRVARIQRESDRVTEQLAVDVVFEQPPPRVTLGEQVEATIRPPPRLAALALPAAALVRRPEGTGVLVVEEGRLRFRKATFGLADPAGWIETWGVAPGEHVVLAPGSLADAANEGRRVRAEPEAPREPTS